MSSVIVSDRPSGQWSRLNLACISTAPLPFSPSAASISIETLATIQRANLMPSPLHFRERIGEGERVAVALMCSFGPRGSRLESEASERERGDRRRQQQLEHEVTPLPSRPPPSLIWPPGVEVVVAQSFVRS